MPKTKKRRRNSSEANPTYSLLKKALIGGFISTAIYFLFLLLCALAVMNLKVTDSMQNVVVFSLASVSTFIASFFMLKKDTQKGLYSGVVISFSAAIITSIVLLTVIHSLGAKTIIMALLMIIGGALGGITAVNSHKK